MKENDGRGSRRRRKKKFLYLCGMIMVCGLFFLSIILMVFVSNDADDNPNGYGTPTSTGRSILNKNLISTRNNEGLAADTVFQQRQQSARIKSSPTQKVVTGSKNKKHNNKNNNESHNDDVETRILNGELHLINLHIPFGALRVIEGGTKPAYKGVRGLFCPLDWSIQKKDPASVPMFKHLVSQSPLCEHDTHSVYSFSDIVQKARAHDNQNAQQQQSQTTHRITSMDVGGFIFHESRCGSTLVSNVLAAVSPDEHRVYSESTPIINTVLACSQQHRQQDFQKNNNNQDSDQFLCSDVAAAELLKDVVYMMGRTNNVNEKRQYFKMQSIGIEKMNVVTLAFPTVPWIFLYRNPIQVMMSYFKEGDKSNSQCLRGYHDHRSGRSSPLSAKSTNGMSKEEFCAATLASFCDGAIRHYEMTGTGRFINYESLKDVSKLCVLLEDFGVFIGETELERIEQISAVYSKKRTTRGSGNIAWVEDSTEKETSATPEVRAASDQFLVSSYTKLQQLAL